MDYCAGIDLGSTAIKVVLVKDGNLLWHKATPTAPGQDALAHNLLLEGMHALGLPENTPVRIASTGYGKKLLLAAEKRIDEVSANALGLFRLSEGNVRVIINIGGQDIKIIWLDEQGKLQDFKMNDKCAAGTGRFFEMAARILDTPIESFSALAEACPQAAMINSTCAVFAESEIVSLLAKGTPKDAIIKGLLESVARRISGMVGRASMDCVYLDGGSANNHALALALEDELFTDVDVLPLPQFTVAYGAACSLEADAS